MPKIGGKSAGVVFVKKANMWLYQKCFNTISKTDIKQWFKTQEEANEYTTKQTAS